MNALLNSAFFPMFAVVAFVAVVLFFEALFSMWNTYKGPEAKKIEQRLQALSAGGGDEELTAVLKNRMLSETPFFERFLLKLPRAHQLDRFLLQSGLDWTVAKLLSLSLLSGLTVYVMLALVYANLPIQVQLILVIVATVLPWFFVQWKRTHRLRKIEAQLPDTLDLMGRALRAGHALPSGLKMAGEEMADPIATEFRITHDEINFGVSTPQALNNLCARVPITDVRYFVIAVLIQREAGGNLTEVLDKLSKLIRERLKFHGRVKVLTTEGRMSAWVLGLLPFALAGMLNLVNPEFISTLWTDPLGIKITNVVLTMMAVGAVWLYKLVQIRV
jgi:tight adherence protein B